MKLERKGCGKSTVVGVTYHDLMGETVRNWMKRITNLVNYRSLMERIASSVKFRFRRSFPVLSSPE
jgi:hypothetical protein